MQNIGTFDLIDGALMSLLAIYFLLGLFSDATWLHTDWSRKAGRWHFVFTPPIVRMFLVLMCGLLAVRRFFEAFHRDSTTFDFTINAIVLAGFVTLFFIGWKHKHDDDTTA
jgi:hypothetical protein